MILFKNRKEAGVSLAKELGRSTIKLSNPIVFGIPRGGIPIGYQIAKQLGCPLDTIVLRKLPIPDDPEAGFGAVTLDKVTVLNEPLVSQLGLEKSEIDRIIRTVYQEVLRRNKVYRQGKPVPVLTNRSVILADDGLASGYTMLAAIQFARQHQGKDIIVVSPVAHREAYQLVKQQADRVLVLHLSGLLYFAVASFYCEFPDMADTEIIAYLETPNLTDYTIPDS